MHQFTFFVSLIIRMQLHCNGGYTITICPSLQTIAKREFMRFDSINWIQFGFVSFLAIFRIEINLRPLIYEQAARAFNGAVTEWGRTFIIRLVVKLIFKSKIFSLDRACRFVQMCLNVRLTRVNASLRPINIYFPDWFRSIFNNLSVDLDGPLFYFRSRLTAPTSTSIQFNNSVQFQQIDIASMPNQFDS